MAFGQQLSVLLGRRVQQIRKTSENPPRASVIDVISVFTGKTQHDAAQDFRRITEQWPEVVAASSFFKFPGKRQRETPVMGARGVLMRNLSKFGSDPSQPCVTT